jgi:hypothetical protein
MLRNRYRVRAHHYLWYIYDCISAGVNVDDTLAAREFVLSTAAELGEELKHPRPPFARITPASRRCEDTVDFIWFGIALINVAVAEERITLADICARKCGQYFKMRPEDALIILNDPYSKATTECIDHLLRWLPTEVLDSLEVSGLSSVDKAIAQRREWRVSVAANPGQADTLETLLCVLPTILADDGGLPLELILEIFRWL